MEFFGLMFIVVWATVFFVVIFSSADQGGNAQPRQAPLTRK
jgi:hypothetical protein